MIQLRAIQADGYFWYSLVQIRDEDAHEIPLATTPKKALKKVKKLCSHLLIDKWMMHNLEFPTLLLISEDGSDTKDVTETDGEGDKNPHNAMFVIDY